MPRNSKQEFIVTWNSDLIRNDIRPHLRTVANTDRSATFGLLTVLTILVLAVAAGHSQRVHAQAVELLKVDVSVVAKGYRVSKLIGTSVKNDKNEKIGSIDDMIVDKQKVLYAILQVGGFLGVGGRMVAIRYDQLDIDDTGKNIKLPGATKEQIEKLEEFKYRSS
jgi:hypothetical protein